MTLHLSHAVLHLPLRDPFRIARQEHGEGRAATTVIVELSDDRWPEVVGLGEGFPDRFYGETPASMVAAFPILLEAVGEFDPSPDGLRSAASAMEGVLRWNGAAKCALDLALHDLVGKVTGRAVVDLLGLGREIPPTDFTLGLDEPAVVAERARRAARFPALKIKVGGPTDLRTLEAVRAVYGGALRVDANTGWTPDSAASLLPALETLGVELIEQPFPAGRLDWLAELQARTALPIVADESAVTIEHLDALRGVVAGVNVKLAKCGGIGPAIGMLTKAREMGFRTFLGCMEETSIGIAGSAVVGSLADWADLDGSLLLSDDPFEGLELGEDCRWRLPDGPGLGVRRSANALPAPREAAEPPIRAQGLVWAGVRTERRAEMHALLRDVLGIPLEQEAEDLVIFRLPDTALFEILGPEWADPVGYPAGPVIGFWVLEVDAAAAALEAAGVELVGPTLHEGEHRWQHFRGPDGNLYQVASGPYRRAT